MAFGMRPTAGLRAISLAVAGAFVASTIAPRAAAQAETAQPATAPAKPEPPVIPAGDGAAKPAAERMKGELERLRERRERARADAELALKRRLVPQPMDAARLGTLLGAIDPKLASDATLVDGYRTYLDAFAAIAEEPGRQILQLAPACYAFDGARESFEPRPTPELTALLALRDRALRRARDAESQLLSLIERLAPSERRSAFLAERVAWSLERVPRAGTLSSTSVTLLEIVARLDLDEGSRTLVAPLLSRYAEELVKLLAARADTLARADAERARIETEAGALWRYAAPEVVAETERTLAAVDASELAAEVAIRNLHGDWLRIMRLRLEPRQGRRLVEAWQRAVHPELFDDEQMLSRLAEEVLALPSLGEDGQRAFLEALEAGYQRLEPLARAACEASDLVLPRAGEATNAELAVEIDARIGVVDTQRKRRGVLREVILRLRGVAPNDSEPIVRRFDDLLATLEAYERADRFERASLESRFLEVSARDASAVTDAVPAAEEPAKPPTGSAPAAAPPAREPQPPAGTRPENRSGQGSRGSRRGVNNL